MILETEIEALAYFWPDTWACNPANTLPCSRNLVFGTGGDLLAYEHLLRRF